MVFFVSFDSKDKDYRSHLSLEALETREDLELLAKKASELYKLSITQMKEILARIESDRARKKPLYARIMWDIGNAAFELRDKLAKISLEIDGMYSHLERDLGVRKKWLEKVIILRRYIKKRNLIPKDITWSRFEHSTRKKAERLTKGLSIE